MTINSFASGCFLSSLIYSCALSLAGYGPRHHTSILKPYTIEYHADCYLDENTEAAAIGDPKAYTELLMRVDPSLRLPVLVSASP